MAIIMVTEVCSNCDYQRIIDGDEFTLKISNDIDVDKEPCNECWDWYKALSKERRLKRITFTFNGKSIRLTDDMITVKNDYNLYFNNELMMKPYYKTVNEKEHYKQHFEDEIQDSWGSLSYVPISRQTFRKRYGSAKDYSRFIWLFASKAGKILRERMILDEISKFNYTDLKESYPQVAEKLREQAGYKIRFEKIYPFMT